MLFLPFQNYSVKHRISRLGKIEILLSSRSAMSGSPFKSDSLITLTDLFGIAGHIDIDLFVFKDGPLT